MENSSSFISAHASVNGIQMYYEIHGSGRPLVLIHGGGSAIGTTFGKILPLLAEKFRCIAVELQAHGRTSDRDAPESFEQDASDVASLLDHLGISSADILGFSNGAQTAMQLGISYPAKVGKLVLVSGFSKRSGVPAGFWEGMNNASFSDMPQAFKDEFLKLNNDPDALMNMFQKDVQRMQTFKGWPDDALHSIRATTLVLSGDHDVATPEHAVELFRLIPRCSLAIIPGGHGAALGEITTLVNDKWKQEYVVQLIEQFLMQAEQL